MSGPYNGFEGGFDQPGVWGRNDSGNYFIRRIHGDKASLITLGNQISNVLGLTYEVVEGHVTSTLEIHYPWNYTANNQATDLVVKWELFAAGSEKDLLEAQVEVPGVLGTLSQNQINSLRFLVQSPPTWYPTAPDPDGNPSSAQMLLPIDSTWFTPPKCPNDPGGGAGNADNALAVYNLMMQGVRSHPVDQPILRRTMITNQSYAVALALSNVRKIFSTASLISLEGVSSDSLFHNPANGQLLLPTDVSSVDALAYGWYKTFPTVQELALLKYSIVQEWKYGLWATLIWGTPL